MKLKNKKAVRQDDLLLTTFSLLQLNGKKLFQNRVDVCLLLVDFIQTFYQKPPTVFRDDHLVSNDKDLEFTTRIRKTELI